jgi:hypothetical protein
MNHLMIKEPNLEIESADGLITFKSVLVIYVLEFRKAIKRLYPRVTSYVGRVPQFSHSSD